MQYRSIPYIDKPIANIVQGTAMLSSLEMEQANDLLDAVYASGGNAFDTAHSYGDGDCERKLGRWVDERGLRDRVVIISKGAHPNVDRIRVTPFDITADLFDSLARLQIEAIDLYLLHRDDPSVSVGPIMEILNEHQQAGRIDAFGASNWSHERIQAANEYAAGHGLAPFVASSPQFSLAVPMQEPWPGCISISGPAGAAARDWYQKMQMPLLTWSSLAGGFFSGRFRPDNLDTFSDEIDQLCVETYCCEANFQRLERAAILARAKGLTLAQVAMAYVMSQPLNIFAIVGCQNGSEFADLALASEIELTTRELAWLDVGGQL